MYILLVQLAGFYSRFIVCQSCFRYCLCKTGCRQIGFIFENAVGYKKRLQWMRPKAKYDPSLKFERMYDEQRNSGRWCSCFHGVYASCGWRTAGLFRWARTVTVFGWIWQYHLWFGRRDEGNEDRR